jgi:hypothetical protein
MNRSTTYIALTIAHAVIIDSPLLLDVREVAGKRSRRVGMTIALVRGRRRARMLLILVHPSKHVAHIHIALEHLWRRKIVYSCHGGVIPVEW